MNDEPTNVVRERREWTVSKTPMQVKALTPFGDVRVNVYPGGGSLAEVMKWYHMAILERTSSLEMRANMTTALLYAEEEGRGTYTSEEYDMGVRENNSEYDSDLTIIEMLVADLRTVWNAGKPEYVEGHDPSRDYEDVGA